MADDAQLLEEGDIFFFYRPKTNEDDPSGVDDVQQFYLALRPTGGKLVRLCVAGRKYMPKVGEHQRVWGFVDMVADEGRRIEEELREVRYDTKTRGEQQMPAARPAGEGVYAITMEDGQMHLSYRLELPEDPGPVQRAFNIAPEASYALSVKNPEVGQPVNTGLDERAKADYPDRLQEEFRGRRWAVEDARLMDFEGAEFLLVGARTDPDRAYDDVDLDAEREDYDSADAIRRLRMVKSRHPVAPLFEGTWE